MGTCPNVNDRFLLAMHSTVCFTDLERIILWHLVAQKRCQRDVKWDSTLTESLSLPSFATLNLCQCVSWKDRLEPFSLNAKRAVDRQVL